MVYAMVQWSRALLTGGGGRAWAAAYAGAWLLILALSVRFLAQHAGLTAGNLAVLGLVAVGWWVLHGLLVAFGRALGRAEARGRAPVEEEPDEVEPPSESRPAPPGPPTLLRRLGGWVVSLAVVFGLLILGELSPPMQALDRTIAARETRWLVGAIGLASLGFVLLMGGAIHLALRGTPRRGGGSASLAEMKAAWRTGAWRRSPRGRRVFAMAAGALLMVVGVFGIPFVLGSAGIKLLVAAAWAYVAFQLVRGFRRADVRTGGAPPAGSPPDGPRSRRGRR
jgi:hypothetical protein